MWTVRGLYTEQGCLCFFHLDLRGLREAGAPHIVAGALPNGIREAARSEVKLRERRPKVLRVYVSCKSLPSHKQR